jgi:glycerophosphoryl diester phosphodiesterase
MRFCLFLAGVLLLQACSVSKTAMKKSNQKYNPVIAHRGAFKKNGFPENSIASLREAIRLGCAGTEFDVRMTADDSLVVNHDPHFAKLDIEKHTYAELAAHTLSNGETLPTLRSYLLAGSKDNKRTRLILEIKPSPSGVARGELIATKVLQLVKDCGAEAITEYISFDLAILKQLLKIDNKVITHYLNGELSPYALKSLGIRGMDYNYSVYQKNPDWITESKNAGVILNVWTVNESAKLDWCIQQKFDFITTNEPELLFQKLITR